MISLTIKEGGDLDNLRKQLTALVGKSGQKKFRVKLDESIGRDITNIKNQLYFLSPAMTPRTDRPLALSEDARRQKEWLRTSLRKAAEKVIPKEISRQFTMQGEQGVENYEDLVDVLEMKMEDFANWLQLAEEGKLSPEQTQGLINAVKDLRTRMTTTDKERKGLFTNIENRIGELNSMFSDLLEAKGIEHLPEFALYELTNVWWDKIKKTYGRKKLGPDLPDLMPGSARTGQTLTDEGKKEAKEIATKLSRAFANAKGTISYLDLGIKKLRELGYDIDVKEMFSMKKIQQSPALTALAGGLFKVAFEKGGPVPKGFHQYIAEIVKPLSLGGKPEKVSEMFKQMRPDFLIIKGDIEKLKDLLGENIANVLAGKELSFIDLKATLRGTQGIIDQFTRYEKGLEYFAAVGNTLKESFTKYLPNIQQTTLNILSELIKVGAIKQETDDALKMASEEKFDEEDLTKETLESVFTAELKRTGWTKENIDSLMRKMDKLAAEQKAEENKQIDFGGEPFQ